MLTFKELAKPVPGWSLDRIEQSQGGLWTVTLRREHTGYGSGRRLSGASSKSIEHAWESARSAAEHVDAKSGDARAMVL